MPAELQTTYQNLAPLDEINGGNDDPLNDSWRPLILSLDGGGIRGLSSLYILKAIMEHIYKLEHANDSYQSSPATDEATKFGRDIVLPCHYFGYMIGTSTGGLIAIMLGRLRMTVDECIAVYEELGRKVFRYPRWWHLRKYSAKRLERVCVDVVKKYCKECPQDSCEGSDPLCQLDHVHDRLATPKDEHPRNRTCKTAVVAMKRGSGDSNVLQTHIFRSYDHPPACNPHSLQEFNPGFADRAVAAVQICHAARATAAAPLYFKPALVAGQEYIDGGVKHNNPVELALNEVYQMSEGNVPPLLLLSVGTGTSKPQSRFGSRWGVVFDVLKAMQKAMTDTETPHQKMQEIMSRDRKTSYNRFNVGPVMLNKERAQLKEIALDEWKEARYRGHGTDQNLNIKWRCSGTAEKIQVITEKWCETEKQSRRIKEVARTLFDCSQSRQIRDGQRWKAFRSDPSPNVL